MKWNQKLKNKFFNLFCVLYIVEKQVYKLKLPTQYDIFHVLLLKQDNTKKAPINQTMLY